MSDCDNIMLEKVILRKFQIQNLTLQCISADLWTCLSSLWFSVTWSAAVLTSGRGYSRAPLTHTPGPQLPVPGLPWPALPAEAPPIQLHNIVTRNTNTYSPLKWKQQPEPDQRRR